MRVTEELEPVAVTERARGSTSSTSARTWSAGSASTSQGERGTRVQLRFAEMLERRRLAAPGEPAHRARSSTPTSLRGRRARVVRAALHLPRLPLRRGHRPHRGARPSPAAWCIPTRPAAAGSSARTTWSTSCGGTSTGASAATSSRCPTDCPQRDERLGWLADAQVFLPTATLNMDVGRVHHQVGRRRARRAVAGGRVLRTSRRGSRSSATAPPAWADAGVIVPWIDVAPLRRPAAARAPLGRDGALHGLPAAPQPRPPVDGAARQRLRRLALGRRADAARRARHRVLGLRREADGRDGAGARARRPRRRTTSACGRGSSPRSTTRTSATTPTSRATPRPSTCSRCTWT